jgi:hypothetical protein
MPEPKNKRRGSQIKFKPRAATKPIKKKRIGNKKVKGRQTNINCKKEQVGAEPAIIPKERLIKNWRGVSNARED